MTPTPISKSSTNTTAVRAAGRVARTSPRSRSTSRPVSSRSTRYVVVEDCGLPVNPAIVEGQIRGGVAQGIGAVLLEHAAYDDDGQFMASTFMDYLMPTTTDVPNFEIHHVETIPTDPDVNFRGVGEGGMIVAPATHHERDRGRPRAARCPGAGPTPPALEAPRAARDGAGMKNAPFEYHAPGTVDEVLALLAEHADEAKVLAGGQSLVPLLAMRLARPAQLIDINGVAGLAGITPVNGDGVAFGALTREREAERSALVAERLPVLAEALPMIGHVSIRNRGTVGGSIAHADASAELPAVAVVTGAEMVVRSAGAERVVAGGRLLRRALHDLHDRRRAAHRGPCAVGTGRCRVGVPRDRSAPR